MTAGTPSNRLIQLVTAGSKRGATAAAIHDKHSFAASCMNLRNALGPKCVTVFAEKPFGIASEPHLSLVAKAPQSGHIKTSMKVLDENKKATLNVTNLGKRYNLDKEELMPRTTCAAWSKKLSLWLLSLSLPVCSG